MKRILLFALASFLAISFSNFSLSQIKTTKVTTSKDSPLKESFLEYELFSINTEEIYQKTKDRSENIQFSLSLGEDYDWGFLLEESGLRPEGSITRVKTANGINQVPTSENSTYKGYLNNNSDNTVRLSIRQDEILGMVKSDGEMFFIEPASKFDQNLGKDIHVVYNVKDVIKDEHSLCGVTEERHKSLKTKDVDLNGLNTKSNRSACQLAELAIAADGSMTVKHGSVANVEQHLLDIMNVVQDRYFDPDINIEYSVTELFIVDAPANDPNWSLGSSNFENFLNAFTSWGPTGFSANHDVACLWSNRNFDGDAVGLAWVGTVCTNNRYNVLQDFTPGMTQLIQVQTHELGHNWSAGHTASANNTYVMAPSIGTLNDQWIGQSITDIVNHKDSRPCLDANCGTPDVPVTDFSANQTTVLEGGIVEFTDLTSGIPSSWSWTITPGSAGVEWEYVNATSATSQNPEVQFNTIGDYTIELTATNSEGNDTETKVEYISVIPTVCGDPLNTAYTMGFEDGEDLSQWVIINANGDNNSNGNQNTWQAGDISGIGGITQGAHTGTNTAVYFWNDDGTTPADDWLITGCMDLVAGATYTLSYWWSTDDGYAETMEVFVGTDQTVADMTQSIHNLGTVQDVTWQEEVITFTVPSNGEYYIGFHCTSAADQYYLVLDDINLSGAATGITVTDAPGDITVECDESTDPSNTGDLTATSDCNPATVTVDYTDVTTAGTCANAYSIERTWEATDNCGNLETHVQTITVEDNTNPVVNCGVTTDVISTSGGSATLPDYVSGSTFSDNCTANGDLVITQNPTAGTSMSAGTYTVDITAEDECGNIGSCSVTVTVENNEDITITNSPGDLTLECDESTDPSNTGEATATTSCGAGGLTINYTDNVTSGSCVNAQVIERTWEITDNCGNNETFVQTITVDDNTAPVVVCGQSTDQLNTSTTVPLPDYTTGSTFNDNCTATGDLTITQNPSAGTAMSPGFYVVEITAEDECGNISTCEIEVTVINDDGITITIAPNDVTIECNESVDPTNTGGLTAQTSCATGGLTVDYADVSDNQSCPETITRTWTITDDCGASETHEQIITVDDLTAPTGNPISSVNLECFEDIPTPNTSLVTGVSDNCTVNPDVYFIDDVSNGQSCPETITRTYGVEDDCGNVTEITQDFIIEDVTNPTVDPLNSITFGCIEDVPTPNTGLVNASDNCTTNPTVSHIGDVSDGNSCPETITRTYRVEDNCGNFTEVTQSIVVNDDTNPVISCAVTSETILASQSSAVPDYSTSTTASDNCTSNPTITQSPAAASTLSLGSNIITMTATDDCGNESTCTIDVLYEDDASLDENELSSVSFYPNPTTNILNIDFGTEMKDATIVLYDANGKLLVDKKVQNKESETIDLSIFAKGMYTVIVHSKDGTTTQKVSKM